MGGIAWYANYILKKLFRGTISRSSPGGSLWERGEAGDGQALSLGLGVMVTVRERHLEPEISHCIQPGRPPLLDTRGPLAPDTETQGGKAPEVGRQESGCWLSEAADASSQAS